MSSRFAWASLVIALAGLAPSAPVLAQETRSLPAADRVPLHSSVEVSGLPVPRVSRDAGGVPVEASPRRQPDPEGFRRLKESLQEPGRVPDTVEAPTPRAASAPPTVVASFEGLANLPDNAVTGFSVAPSDANLAVGPDHVFEMVNLVGRITNKSGGAASTFTLRSFFQLDSGTKESDPRVFYDAASNRWFATYAQFTSTQSSVILAVSTTNDPTGTFCVFRLGNPTSETFVQDSPQLGISDDKVIVTYNAFAFAPENFLGGGYYAVNKGDLVAGSGCPSSVRRVRVPPDLTRFGVQPAQSVSSTGTLYMAMNAGPVSGVSAVNVFGVNGVPGVGSVTEDSFIVIVRAWLTPPDAEQAGSALRLNTNDRSVITAVWQRGSLWIGGNERCTPSDDSATRSCLRVVQIQTDARSVQQNITFGSSGQYYYFPALSPDGAGNLIVVFNASSATDFAGVRVTGRLVSDPPNTLAASMLVRAGGGAETATVRMGDYYGAALDPADPSKVWVTAEYIRTTVGRDWGTFVAQLTFMPPTLALTLNSHTFKAGDTLQASVTMGNPGGPVLVDVYFGGVLPPAAGPAVGCPLGDAIAFATAGSSTVVIRCLSGSPATFPRFASTSLAAGLPPTPAPFFSFVWPSAPAGLYTIFVAFVVPGALADGNLGPADIIVIASDVLTFSP